MKKNLSLTIINVSYLIFLAWFITFTKDMSNIAAIVFLIIIDIALGILMT